MNVKLDPPCQKGEKGVDRFKNTNKTENQKKKIGRLSVF